MKKLLLLILLLMLPAFAVLNVSSTGNDATGDGSYTLPYATVGKAVNTTTGNDTIYVIGGWINEGLRITTAGKHNLTIVGNESANVILSVRAGICGSILAIESNSFTIENMTIRGNGSSSWNCNTGIQLGGQYENFTAHNVVIENFGTAGSTDAAIAQWSNISYAYNNIVLDNVTMNRTQEYGYYNPAMTANNTYFNHVSIETNGTYIGGTSGSRPKSYNLVIENSTFYCSKINACSGIVSLEATGYSPQAIFRNLVFQYNSGRIFRWRSPLNSIFENITVVNGSYNTHMVLFDLKSDNVTIANWTFGSAAIPIDTPGGNILYFNNANNTLIENIYMNVNRSTSSIRIDSDTYNSSNNRIRNIFINGTNSSPTFVIQAGSTVLTGGRIENTSIQNINITMPQDGYGLTDVLFIGHGNITTINNISLTGAANGLRIEDNNNTWVANFTWYNQSYRAIWLNGGNNITLRNGYVYDQKNGTAILNISGISAARPSNNIDIANMVFNTSGNLNLTLMSYFDGNVGIVSSNNNRFEYYNCSFTNFMNNSARYNFTAWRSVMGLEYNSSFVCSAISPVQNNITFPLNGTTHNGNMSVTWLNFTDPNNLRVGYNITLYDTVFAYVRTATVNTTDLNGSVDTTLVPDGLYNLVVYGCDVTDLCVNATIQFIIDNTPPLYNWTLPVNDTVVSTSNVSINYTLLNGSDADICGYYLDGNFNTIPLCKNYSILIGGGRHTLQLFANDTLGNSNTTEIRNITRDTYTPSLTVQSPLNNSLFATTTIPLNFIVSDNLSSITCAYSLDQSANQSIVNCANTSFNALNGRHTIIIYANDTAGNLNATQRNFTVDTVSPTLTVQQPVLNEFYTSNNISLNYTIRDALSNVTACMYSLDGAANVSILNCRNTSFILAKGQHSLQLVANDTNGNNVTSAYLTFFVQSYNFSINITEPLNGSNVSDDNITIRYIVPSSFIDSCWFSINNTVNTSLSNCANFTLYNLANTSYNVTVYANDTFGTLNSSVVTFFISPSLDIEISSPNNQTAVYSMYNLTIVLDIITHTMDLSTLNCSISTNYTTVDFVPNESTSIALTPPVSGVYNITADCTDGSLSSGYMVELGYFKIRTYNISYTPPRITYEGFLAYSQLFYGSYLEYVLALFAYGIAYLISKNYQTTLLAGGVGLVLVFFITQNPIMIAGALISLLVAFVLKYAGG